MLANELGIDAYYQKNKIFKAIRAEISRLVSDKNITPIIILDEADSLKQQPSVI